MKEIMSMGQFLKKVKQHKLKVIVTVVLTLLIISNIITYIIWADSQLPGDVRNWLPQYSQGSKLQFACVSQKGWKALSAKQQQQLLEMLRSEFETLYFDEKDIPEDKWLYHPERPDLKKGLKNGCILDWKFKKQFLILRAEYDDWEGLRAGSYTPVTYVWFLGIWISPWPTSTAVS